MANIEIHVLITVDWKHSAFACKFGMSWVYVCSGVSIMSNLFMVVGKWGLYFSIHIESPARTDLAPL